MFTTKNRMTIAEWLQWNKINPENPGLKTRSFLHLQKQEAKKEKKKILKIEREFLSEKIVDPRTIDPYDSNSKRNYSKKIYKESIIKKSICWNAFDDGLTLKEIQELVDYKPTSIRNEFIKWKKFKESDNSTIK